MRIWPFVVALLASLTVVGLVWGAGAVGVCIAILAVIMWTLLAVFESPVSWAYRDNGTTHR